MDKQDALSLLSVQRAGEDVGDPRFAEAEKQVATDPELARWWAEEQEIDRAIAAKLAAAPVPADLKARLTSRAGRAVPLSVPQRSWRRAALLAAAVIVALAVLFGSWRGPFQPAVSLADYRDEMVSFVKVTRPLELETSDLARITHFLTNAGAPAQIEIPAALRKLDPVGCRVLRFRGHDVTLICFQRGGGRLVHLLVMEGSALRGVPEKTKPDYAPEGEWMTAAWRDRDNDYLLAVQGDQATLQKYLPSS